jgi:pantoate--beta-alanine ligase
MQTLERVQEVRDAVAAMRRRGERVAFVPTMGNLHAGHLALVRRAGEVASRVVASIFVNPLQFGPAEDFAGYPRTPDRDRATLATAGTQLLFMPPLEEIYPRGAQPLTRVQVVRLGEILCGASRPGHFDGVATVVNLLLNIVQPDVALFGEKDYQQLLVIRRMVADLHLPVEILGLATVREPDGLAMSSRNGYLSAAERQVAPRLYAALCGVRDGLAAGRRDLESLEREAAREIEQAGMRPDYLQVRRAADLERPGPDDVDLRVMGAAWLGRARLIDNVSARPAR